MSLLAGTMLVFVLAITVGGAVLLYLLVRTEHDDRAVMDRESAQRAARKDRHEKE